MMNSRQRDELITKLRQELSVANKVANMHKASHEVAMIAVSRLEAEITALMLLRRERRKRVVAS